MEADKSRAVTKVLTDRCASNASLPPGSQTQFGNPFLETPFPERGAARGQARETEFQGVRSQTEFGNEKCVVTLQ